MTQGIVQGVGFRPYVYRLAVDLNLKGYVRNLGNVVEIIIEGENTDSFINRLPMELPPIAKIDSMTVEDIDEGNYSDFEIIESGDSYSGISVIPPDIAICDKCLEEIRTPSDRRYKYPFNACTDCGPRFTVIESVPVHGHDRLKDRFGAAGDLTLFVVYIGAEIAEAEVQTELPRIVHVRIILEHIDGFELSHF